MSGISIVAFLVHCGQSLLLCQEVDTRDLAFRDMGACREQLSGIIAAEQHRAGDARVVMGKCRYLLVEPPRTQRVARLPKPRHMPGYASALAANGGAQRTE
jgi:hypothetical protein